VDCNATDRKLAVRPPIDADFSVVVDAWPRLSAPIRAAIVAIVKSNW
jgi:hypothetical protein